MSKKKYSEEQIIKFLKEGSNGIAVPELCRKYGFGQSSYFKWKAKYSGMEVSQLKELKRLEGENNRLKKLYTDLSLDHQILKEVLEKK